MNEVASLNLYNSKLALEYNNLDAEMDNRGLSSAQSSWVDFVANELEKIWTLEKIKARQRSRDRNIFKGGRNMTYFQVVANHRIRKKVDVLEGPIGLVEDQNGLMGIALAFYKDLFKKEDRLHISLSQNFWGQEHLVLDNENDLLIAPFSEAEIKEVVWSCYVDGAPRPEVIGSY